jgi:FkbM family methyltransferase
MRRQHVTGVKTLRGFLPLKYRSLARAAWRNLEAAAARLIALALRLLPAGVSIELRDRLVLERLLDYSQAPILLRATSRLEIDVRARSCAKEPETVAWIERTLKADDVLYDIGANVGAYSLVAASWTRRQATIYAFEPGYTTFPNLVANIFANQCEAAVVPFQVALGAETTLAEFRYTTLDPGGADHGGIVGAGKSRPGIRSQWVPSFRLDDFVTLLDLRSPTHIKIDVDGGELPVLRGADRLLKSPTLRWILVEVNVPGRDGQDVDDLLTRFGFHLESDHAHRGGTTHNWIFTRGL